MQDINAWLNNPNDFELGKKLYIQFGKNSFFKDLLNSGPTPYNTKKLWAELNSLAPATPASILAPAKATNKSLSNPLPTDKLQPAASNTEDFTRYLELKELLKATYRQLERNMIELDLTEKESLLHLIAENILTLQARIQDIYQLIDYYDDNQAFPKTKLIKSVYTPAEEIQKLRVSTSKAKTRLKGNCRDRPATLKLIEENNNRIIELGGRVKA